MNKSELISEVASKTALPKKDAEKAVNAFIDTVKIAEANVPAFKAGKAFKDAVNK